MTTHRRAIVLRAGVLGALVVGALAVAAPAYAADKVDVSVTPGGVDLSPGQAANLKVSVTNKTTNDTSIPLTLSAPGQFGSDVIFVTAPDCDNVPGPQVSCNPAVGAGKTFEFSVKIGAKATLTSVQAGEQKKSSGAVKATLDGSAQGHAEASFDVTLHGPSQAPSVPQVTGTVQDQTTGQPIKGAVVVLVDSGRCAAESCEAGTDARGNFKFVSTTARPITPGEIQIGATKDGYANGQTTINARAGQAAGPVVLKLVPAAAASATATPDQAGGVAGSATPGTGSSVNARNTSGSGGSSSLSWLLIGLGVLLVLLGIGAIVFLLMRRKGGPDDDDPHGGDRGGPPPPSRGVYRTGEPVGRGAPDPTMVARSGGYGEPTRAGYPGGGYGEPAYARSNANDATAMLRPAGGPGGYDGYPNAGDRTMPGGYPPPRTPYGAPASPVPAPPPPPPSVPSTPRGYGVPAYGAPPEEDYGPPPAPPGPPYGAGSGSPYGQAPGGPYAERPDQGGYGGGYSDGGYGGGGYGGGGYGAHHGEPEEPRHGGGYDPRAGGYPSAGRQAGYDDRGGYAPPEQRGGGYGSGYYDDDPGGTPSRHAAPPPSRGERPPLDWLDD